MLRTRIICFYLLFPIVTFAVPADTVKLGTISGEQRKQDDLVHDVSGNWREALDRVLDVVTPFWSVPAMPADSDFSFFFEIPISNSGTMSIVPVGKIELYDTNNKQLVGIGREFTEMTDGMYSGEKIVDYLPINSEGIELPAGASQMYDVEWNGFAYEGIGTIFFRSPGSEDVWFGQAPKPWERLKLVNQKQSLIAHIQIGHSQDDVPLVSLDEKIPIEITYPAIIKTLNTGLILNILLIILIGGWLIMKKRKEKQDCLSPESHEFDNSYDLAELELARSMAKEALAKKELMRQRKAESQNPKPTQKNPQKKTRGENINTLKTVEKPSKRQQVTKKKATNSNTDTL